MKKSKKNSFEWVGGCLSKMIFFSIFFLQIFWTIWHNSWTGILSIFYKLIFCKLSPVRYLSIYAFCEMLVKKRETILWVSGCLP